MSDITFKITEAVDEDQQNTCIVCGMPYRDINTFELYGKPVENVVKMKTRDATIWRGLHNECLVQNTRKNV